MVGVETSIGIGVFGGGTSSSSTSTGGTTGEPVIFNPDGTESEFELDKPAKKVLVILDRIPQIPIIDYAHPENTDTVTFPIPLDNGSTLMIIPFY